MQDENGKIYAGIGLVEDITEQKEKEEEVEKEKERYESLFEENPEAIVEVDEDFNIIKVNSQFEDLFKYEEEEILGKHLDDLVVPRHKKDEGKILNKRSRKKGYFDHETVRIDKYGNEVDVAITGRPIKQDGNTHHLAVYRDISERKKAERREKFLHTLLRHDIKNKVQVVQGYLQLLHEDEDLSNESYEYLVKALKENKRSMNLSEKIRLLLGTQKEEKKPVKIVSIINDSVDESKSLVIDKGMGISLGCPSVDCEVEGGPLLKEVFSNLIDNSVYHSEGNKVRITGEVTEDEVICTVEDDGRGISEEEKEKIFERGYTTDSEKGTGLGLFLVKMLIETYGGKIEAKDSELGGARFDVHLKKTE